MSSFHGYAARIRSIQDVSGALNMALTIPELASANHLMCAYRFGDGDKWNQNFDSDGDCGVGLHMLEYMIDNTIDSTILIVARHCTTNCITTLHHNIQSLPSKFDDLKLLFG